ncbi:MAG TPA: PAS domain S-box protein [Fimbriimonadaceae bacterium]|nr:PAS domain S-box protein [Fimbriimonadaceae bacterium]
MADYTDETESGRPRLQLSDREQQLIKLASRGQTDTAIAHRLGISEATVGTYWGRIRIKLGPYSRTELVSIILRAEQEQALNALREQNAELVRELQSAAETARDETNIYQVLLENAPDATILVSESGILTSANAAAHELFGYERESMVGLPVTNLMPDRFREEHDHHRLEYVSDPRRRAMGAHLATPALKKDGTEFQIRASLSAIRSPTGLLITCAVRPVLDEPLSSVKLGGPDEERPA